ncbi:FecR domain-containing protein [Terrimonas sp. NA20]|uniref:FecR domain-containing protein n=1 Tax=Terrimonas ginsenosidimutans TaxID=2908004 RepID=A0ABS9KSB6_9BACT|nr:FecR family protein [Terrimonas ginsenosidimutans]MCG2615165.1 FecR domain-containing protein [Terrimonas ginsenosidimutans]
MEAFIMDTKAELNRIIQHFLDGTATPEEIRFLEAYYDHFEGREGLMQKLSASEKDMLEEKMEAAIFAGTRKSRPVRRISYLRIAAAAVLVGVCITIGLYFAKQKGTSAIEPAPQSIAANDIKPGGDKAVLILADGKKMILDDTQPGEISQQGKAIIRKTSTGQIIYDLSAITAPGSGPVSYNTIQTPVGGQYQVVLADGTKVWLNSKSSLHFPAVFQGSERVVTLEGEGYFEVAKNAAKPFAVKVNDAEVKVLGTHFNIMAYPDESGMKTTLLEGAVTISKGMVTKPLQPGQQAFINGSDKIEVGKADVEAATAWKNGYFKFDNADLRTVMRQLSRWYDMEVSYEGSVPKDKLSGKIRRNINASKALSLIEGTGVRFRIEGKKVIVF